MKHKTKLALLGATATLAAGPAAALGSSSSTVSVRIEGPVKTLVYDKSVKLGAGSITKGGAPKGACSAGSAAGALQSATHGRWTGKYYPSGTGTGIFINTILGIKPPTINDYWTVFVDDRTSPNGICAIKPHQGEQLLFAVTNGSQKPLILKGPRHARIGKPITITAGSLGAHGFVGARVHVSGSGVSATTDGRGQLRVPIVHPGTMVLHADGKGFVRAAPLRITELP